MGRSGRLGRWLLAGLAAAVVALSFPLTAGYRTLMLVPYSNSAPQCLSGPCDTATSAIYHQLGIGAAAGILAAILLVTRRYARPAPVSVHTPVITAVVCAILAPVFLFGSLTQPLLASTCVSAAGPAFTTPSCSVRRRSQRPLAALPGRPRCTAAHDRSVRVRRPAATELDSESDVVWRRPRPRGGRAGAEDAPVG